MTLAALAVEWVRGSERRIVGVVQRPGFDHVVGRPIFVEAVELVPVAGLEQIEDVLDEVVDLEDGVVTEARHRCAG